MGSGQGPGAVGRQQGVGSTMGPVIDSQMTLVPFRAASVTYLLAMEKSVEMLL